MLTDQVETQRKLDAHAHRGFCIECRHSAMMQQLGNAMLVCRRNPPRMSPMPGAQPGTIQFASLFPPVEQNWTCGEFSDAKANGA
jgi:hypothetical protein